MGCAGGYNGPPAWVSDKHSLYPREKYMVEIGVGTSFRAARDDGKATLAQVFGTTIRVDNTIRSRYEELSDGQDILGASMTTTVDDTISQSANETLVNVQFGESWTDEMGRSYVVTYVDREETGRIYKQRIDQDVLKVQSYINQAPEQKETLRRYAFWDAALVVDKEVQRKLEQLEIIHPSYARIARLLPYEPQQLQISRNAVAQEMVFAVSIEGDEDGRLENILTKALTSKGFSVRARGELAVQGQLFMEEVELKNNYENLRWNLTLEMTDTVGNGVAALGKSQRETAVSQEEARSRAYRSMEKFINQSFLDAMASYLDSFVN